MSMESCRWNLTGLRREWDTESWKHQVWMILLRNSAVKWAETTSKKWCLLQGDVNCPLQLSPLIWTAAFFFFLFCIGVMLINNIVIASSEQQRDSAIYIHVSILPQTLLPFRLPGWRWAEFQVMYSRTLLVIHFKYNLVYMSIPNSLAIPSPHPSLQQQ